MSLLRDPKAVATATKCNLKDVSAALPLILAALESEGLLLPYPIIAALATAAVECSFKPICERGSIAYFKKYDGRMGNIHPGDGYKYRGRGIIQITGRANYAKYSKLIIPNVDLIANPDKALELPIACKILAAYWYDHGFKAHCNADTNDCWEFARKAVNGGTNALPRFLECVNALVAIYEKSKNS